MKREEVYAPPMHSKQTPEKVVREEDRKEEGRPSIVLQPLHIAIGVCLIILLLVAVLLHVVVVLHRRQRRLKREFLKQTQKTNSNDVHQQQTHHWPVTSSAQPNVQQINLQQLKYSSASSEQNQTTISRHNKKLVVAFPPGGGDMLMPFTTIRSCLRLNYRFWVLLDKIVSLPASETWHILVLSFALSSLRLCLNALNLRFE